MLTVSPGEVTLNLALPDGRSARNSILMIVVLGPSLDGGHDDKTNIMIEVVIDQIRHRDTEESGGVQSSLNIPNCVGKPCMIGQSNEEDRKNGAYSRS